MQGKAKFFAIGVLGLLAFAASRSCQEKPVPQPAAIVTPPPPLKAVAKARARVVIERPVHSDPGSSQAERIIIETDAESESRIDPSPLMTPLPVWMAPRQNHTRIGVVAGTFPGILALDVQLLRGYPLGLLAQWSVLPPEVQTLELGLDLEFNNQQAGLSLAAGDKVFASLGYFASWTELSHGPFIGIGMRF